MVTMTRYFISTLCLIILTNLLHSQHISNPKNRDIIYDNDFTSLLPTYSITDDEGKEIIKSIPKFDFSEYNKKAELQKSKIHSILTAYQNIKMAQGYRVQVYFGQSKDEVRKAKETVYGIIPDIEIYTQYKQPDYKVKVGDFFYKYEAFNCLGKLERAFPNALIVPEIINLKK
jgi:hypothetical protein